MLPIVYTGATGEELPFEVAESPAFVLPLTSIVRRVLSPRWPRGRETFATFGVKTVEADASPDAEREHHTFGAEYDVHALWPLACDPTFMAKLDDETRQPGTQACNAVAEVDCSVPPPSTELRSVPPEP